MDYIAVIGIAVGLAMDAFAVSVTNGAIVKNFKPSFAIKIAAAFGIFQFMMPVIGWIVGKAGQQLIESVDHYIAFILLLLIGGNMLIEAIKDRIKEYKGEEVQKKGNKTATSTKTLLLMAVATSIDALATGVSRNSAKRAWWQCRYGHSWSMKINERTVLGKGCRICEQKYLSLFPALVISYYANLKGLKVELGSDRLFGIPLDVYIPLEQVAIQVNTDSEKIDILKEHLCKQRGIKLIKLPMKPNEAEPEYAQRIKAAFQSVHIFISSDAEEDVKIIRKIFKNWRNSR